MADVSAAQSTAVKRLKLLGDFSKCRKEELVKKLPKYFEEYYGSVSDLELCDSGTAVTLTLNVMDDATIETMLKAEHEVEGIKISVEVMDEEEPAPLATIVIDGITAKIDEDTLEMYFSNTKKSGGGEIESGSVQINETKGFVTFCDPQVAARVVDKSKHAIKKQPLQVSLYIPPKPEPPPKSADNMLLLKDLPEKFKEGNLELYLDGITDLECEEDEYTYDIKQYEGDTVVLVTFNSEADLDDVINDISKKPFTGHYIKAEKVPACTSVIIKHIPPEKCDKDSLDLYFSNKKKSGVDQYKTIEILANNTAVVDLGDEQSVQIVIAKEHKWLGKEAVICRYDFLSRLAETSSDSPEKTPPVSSQPDALPTPVHAASNKSFQKSITKNMAELCKSQLSSLESLLKEFCASVTIDEGGCIVIDPVSGNESITDWKESCTKLLDDWLFSFDEKEMKIPSALHDKIFRLIVQFQKESSITVTFAEAKSLLHVIGKSDKVAEFVKEVEILRDAELVETEDIALDEKKMIFITQIGYKELSRGHPEIKFTAKDETVLQVEGNKMGREKFLQHLYGLQFFYESLQVSQMLIKFFSSTDAGKAIIQASLRGYESITATLVTNNCFYIIGADKAVITKLLSIIKSKVGEKQIKAPPQLKNVCHDYNWTSLCTEMLDSLSVLTAVSPTKDHVIIAGDFTKVNAAVQRIEQFFSDECYGKERIPLKSGQWKYLSHHAIMEFSKLMSKAENKHVGFQQPKEDDKNPTIVLEGDPDAIRQISAELQALIATICTNNPPLVVSRPGTVRYLVSEDGQTMISGIETRERSCIQLTVEAQSNSVEVTKAAGAVTKSNEKCKATTEEGKVITLVMGDITECTVDVIVNAANDQLIHGDGVAGAILRKGGKIIQEESKLYIQNEGKLFEGDAVMMKKVGNLPCQRLVHAVGPTWKGGDNNEEEFLKSACTESLKLACNYRSIAFPAISAGIYGFPATACAHCMIEAFTSWSKEFGLSTLHDIHVVVNDTSIANAFTEEMQKQLKVLPQFLKSSNTASSSPGDKDTTPSSRRRGRRRHTDSSPSAASPAASSAAVTSPQPMVVNQQMPVDNQLTELPVADILFAKQYIDLLQGDLLKQQADVYVNTASNDLNLNNGAVAKSLLREGGQSLQDECTSYITQNGCLSPGDIVATGPGKLRCKKVIHTVGAAYNESQSEKILEDIIRKCLEEADRCGATSIAFPALGAGNLGYPSNVVARIMVGTVATYIKTHQATTSLETVKLVIYMHETFKEFESALSGKPMTNKKVKSQKSLPTDNFASKPRSMAGNQQPDPVFSAGKLTIEILCGDITDDASDAVVNPTNDRLRLGGGVGKALLKKAGKELENSLDREISRGYRLEEGKVFYTKSSGALKCKFIYHVVSPDGRKANLLSKTVTGCLKKADEQKLASISFPAIGTAGAYKPAEAAQYICEAIIKYGHSNPHHLQHVRIIIFQPDTYQIFIQTCNDILQSSQPGWLTRAYNYVTSVFSGSHDAHTNESVGFLNTENRRKDFQPEQSISAPQSQTFGNIPDNAILCIQVFARNEYEVKQTEVRLQRVIQEHFKVDSIDNDDRVSKLTREQIAEFEEKAKNHQVELKFEPNLKRIRFKGDKEDVNELKTEILNVFSKIAVQEGDEKAAKMLQDKVTWKWLDDDEYAAYDHMVNYSIEQAYQEYKMNGRKDKFTYSDEEEGTCTINFAKMEEKLPDGTTFPIKRSDLEDLLKEAEYPPTWEINPKDSSGKEVACHVVDLQPTDPEYQEIQTAFTSTIPPAGSSGGNIWKSLVKIQRIQNPALYAQYAGRKKIMEKENPQIENEKRLFHGCKGSVVENIYYQGFNRSFAGANATVYGEGAYFAVNASYSARQTYSPPDANGNRFMFYARVLTGEFTQGHKGLKVPPPKDPNRSTVILYDSVVDNVNTPNMYVVFTDAQCYPDYLITFI